MPLTVTRLGDLDRPGWHALLTASPSHDVYYTAEYLESAEHIEPGEVHVAIYEGARGLVLYPFLKRPLSGLPFLEELAGWHDIVTPYEYGGYLARPQGCTHAELLRDFLTSFDSYCRGDRIVCEFLRFHPVLRTHEGCESLMRVMKSCDNVVIDLAEGSQELFDGYSASNRRNVRLAQRQGVSAAAVEPSEENLAAFLDLYYSTMDKVSARRFYYFSPEYFRRLLGNPDISWLYLARSSNGEVIAAATFVHGTKMVHYHLSGTTRGARRLYGNNLLLHQMIQDAKSLGYGCVHLGGGAPSLVDFKGGFSRARAPYYVGQRIIDQEAYRHACELWQRAHPDLAAQQSLYFPQYRFVPGGDEN